MARKPQKNRDSFHVESLKHKDKRKNIPTEELRDFVAQDETAAKLDALLPSILDRAFKGEL